MAKNPFEAGSEYRQGSKMPSLKSSVDFKDDAATPKSKNPYSKNTEYRPGNGDCKPGSTRWNMGEGSVNVIKKPGS